MPFAERGGTMRRMLMRWMKRLCWGLLLPGAVYSAQFTGQSLVPPPAAQDFSLQTADGAEFKLSQQRGKIVLLNFGYTFCPDVCPTTLVELSQVRARLGDAAKRVQIAFITLDPERDTPQRLGIYTKAFDPTFIGLTGSADQLAQVRTMYGVIAEKEAVAGTAAGYLIAHSAYTYVIDREGRLRLLFPFGMSVEEMADDIKLLLRG
jgi:protein SCO1/2